MTSRPWRSVEVAALAAMLSAAGCATKGLEVLRPPLPVLSSVPARAVVEPAELICHQFALDAETNDYRPSGGSATPRWLVGERFTELYREYVAEAGLFEDVVTEAPRDRSDLYLVCRPRLTLKQYVSPSLSGTVLTLGTGLIYTFLGGSAHYRYVDLELAMDVLSPSGRPIATYHCCSRCPEKLATDGEDQLGPLVGYALTRTLEDVTNRISADNDLLMQALSADMTAKGVVPIVGGRMRIRISHPSQVILSTASARIAGQVIGVDRPVRLTWDLNGTRGGTVPLTDTGAPSVKEFAFTTFCREGVAKIALSVCEAGGERQAELARTEMAYLCVPREQPAPEIRKRWAVVIGISQYAHGGKAFPELKYAARDAEAFTEFLRSDRSGGFEPQRVLCLMNAKATVRQVRHALFEFLAKADKDDLVVIFFSGHGMPQPGTDNFFMLCHDTQPERLASTAFPMWDIDTALRRFVRAQRVVVFADACHAGAISSPEGVRGDGDNPVHQYLRQLALAQAGRLIFTASEVRQLSHESRKWGGGHGAFTHFLLTGLNGEADADGDHVVDVGEIVEYVRSKVAAATGGKQHPDPSGQYDRKLPLAVIPRAK
ncbi:MAG: caspase family protein [Phycisphaerae bacterium]